MNMMPVMTDDSAAASKLTAKKESGNRFTDTTTIPWTKLFLNGVEYKLLDYNGERCTVLVRVAKGVKLAIHQHIDPVELYLFDGSFGYTDAATGTTDMIYGQGYMYEPPGTVHEPVSPDGFTGLAIIYGNVRGFDANGNEVLIGPKDYYETARANGATAHLDK